MAERKADRKATFKSAEAARSGPGSMSRSPGSCGAQNQSGSHSILLNPTLPHPNPPPPSVWKAMRADSLISFEM